MNVKLTSTYDGYTSGNVIHCSLYEGSILIARGLAVQHTVADGSQAGKGRRSSSNVTIS